MNEFDDITETFNPDDDDDYDNPGLGELLMLENPNPMAADAMSIAGELRHEGWDASSALAEGWKRAKGESSWNPETFEPSPLLTILVIAAIGTAIYKWKKGQWPWEALSMGKPKARIARPVYVPVRPRAEEPAWKEVIITNVT